MANPLLSTDELTVIGGPETINLQVDFGPQGQRGSLIFAVNGNPNSVNLNLPSNISLNVNDWCININKNDTEYSYMYQYVASPGGNQWEPMLKVNPGTYASVETATFINGQKQINIAISNFAKLTNLATLTSSNFSIQYNILNQKPISSSMTIGDVTTSGDILTLPITIKAVEFDGTNWINLSGEKTLHLLINVV